jgi:uncharacterized protein (TIGR03437 family)
MVATRWNMFLFAVILVGCDVPDPPRLVSIEPDSGGPGDLVTLHGSSLCGGDERVSDSGECDTLPTGMIHFGVDPFVAAAPTTWADAQITVEVPDGVAAGDVLVVVTVDGRSSNGVSFRVE